ncbi:unnamed protein product [Choristocarpus tenellus]
MTARCLFSRQFHQVTRRWFTAGACGSEVVDAAINFLNEKRCILVRLTPASYAAVDEAVGGSVGGHTRHTIDHFQKCLGADENHDSAPIRYDRRDRGGSLEVDPAEAVRAIDKLVISLEEIQREDGAAKLRETTVTPSFMLGQAGEEYSFKSNLERELFFCCHHGFHHDAMIRMILRSQGLDLGDNFGLAPSTVNFQRGNKEGTARCK